MSKTLNKLTQLSELTWIWIYSIFMRSRLRCPQSVTFLGRIKVYNPELITLSENVTLNPGVFLNIGRGLDIGENVTISANVILTDTGLDPDVFPEHRHVRQPIKIEKNVWIGANSIVLPGVVIREGSIIAAGAVVTSSTDPYEIWGGVPAVRIRKVKEK